jgi:hypothetical protein
MPPAPPPMPPMAPPVPMPPPLPAKLHDVTIRRRKNYGCARVEAVPPEEFGISRRAKSIREAGYCFHETPRTVADLIGDGFEPDQVMELATAAEDDSSEAQARNTVDEESAGARDTLNDANRSIKVTEHYVKLDYEDDGKFAIYRVTTAGEGGEILARRQEEDGPYKPDVVKVDMMPFAAMTPVIVTHRFFGRSIADLVMDIQRIKTALQRSFLDNIYLLNNQRMEIAESHSGQNTIDDLLTNRPGGIVRTKQPGGLIPIMNQPIGQMIFPALEYMDAIREWRTGVTRQGQGIDANSLQNQSATAVAQVFSAAQARVRLIARIFAETGIRDLFSLLHATIRKNDTQKNTVRLRNKWVEVDPRNWKTRNDMTINVGLGDGSKQQQLMFITQLLQIQGTLIEKPQLGMVEPVNLYNTLKKYVELGGLKSPEPYITDPTGKPPTPPPPDPKMIEMEGKMKLEEASNQAKMQLEQMKAQIQAQLDGQKMQSSAETERMQAEADIAVKDRETRAQIALKDREFQQKTALEQQKFEFEKQLKLMDHSLSAETQRNKRDDDLAAAGLKERSNKETGKNEVVSAEDTRLEQMISAQGSQTQQMADAIAALAKVLAAPQELVRDETGRALGSRRRMD